MRLAFLSRANICLLHRYTKSSVLVGEAKSFKPKHDYPSSTFEKFDQTVSGLLSECPCVAQTALDGRGFSGSCGEGYTSLGTIWGLRDVIFECQDCQHDTKGGLLQNRVVQNGTLVIARSNLLSRADRTSFGSGRHLASPRGLQNPHCWLGYALLQRNPCRFLHLHV